MKELFQNPRWRELLAHHVSGGLSPQEQAEWDALLEQLQTDALPAPAASNLDPARGEHASPFDGGGHPEAFSSSKDALSESVAMQLQQEVQGWEQAATLFWLAGQPPVSSPQSPRASLGSAGSRSQSGAAPDQHLDPDADRPEFASVSELPPSLAQMLTAQAAGYFAGRAAAVAKPGDGGMAYPADVGKSPSVAAASQTLGPAPAIGQRPELGQLERAQQAVGPELARKNGSSFWLALAATALITGGLVQWLQPQINGFRNSGKAVAKRVQQAPDLVKVAWTRTEHPAAASATGEVYWSDSQQSGVMRFQGLAANDPAQRQYQLWIFDSKHPAETPVDGGVFDIPAGATEAWIPIQAKLPVQGVSLFAITVEQPGGVVVSSRQELPLLAKVESGPG